METLRDVFQFALQRERTIVFGNVGRAPHTLYDALADLSPLQVAVVSKRVPFASSDYRIRVLREPAAVEAVGLCDLLLVLEPESLQIVKKPPLVAHVLVFTTHFTFQTYPNDDWEYVCYFHTPHLPTWRSKTQTLLGLQDFSLQTGNVHHIDVHHAHVTLLRGRPDAAPATSSTYFIVDLTTFDKDTLSMYLAFWDAFDYMLDHLESVHRWVLCFSEHHGRYAFEKFTQKCIDVLLCQPFEHGNVTRIHDILSLIPFYKSGIVDTHFRVPVFAFGGKNIVIPKTMREACQSAMMYNLEHVSKTVYGIRE